jgi:hypothetical protein
MDMEKELNALRKAAVKAVLAYFDTTDDQDYGRDKVMTAMNDLATFLETRHPVSEAGGKRMSSHSHYIKTCSKCATVIEQCRCMDANKTVLHGICDKCRMLAPEGTSALHAPEQKP